MNLSAPSPLDAHHVLDKPECDRLALNDWFLHHARQAQDSGSARPFVVCDGDRIAGFFSLIWATSTHSKRPCRRPS